MRLVTEKYMRDTNSSTKDGIAFLHPLRGTKRIAHINHNGFDYYCCPQPKLFPEVFEKRIGKFVFF